MIKLHDDTIRIITGLKKNNKICPQRKLAIFINLVIGLFVCFESG